MIGRRTYVSMIFIFAVFFIHAACNPSKRYRVLTFFFDGVPPPNATPQVGYARIGGNVPVEETDAKSNKRILALYAHPPFRENRCGGCHSQETGELIRTPDKGLCFMCHQKPQAQFTYVHGPVAVNACLVCHHHHTSPNKKLLLYDETETCLQCHDLGDLGEGSHHQALDMRVCTQCHHAHGGSNRFFLKPGQGSDP